jgi:NTP pyrophosphatase (non-canonical NTP hydrolase)
MTESTFENLEAHVIEWAKDRGIYDNSSATKQFLKAVSEMGEVADGLAKMNMAEIKDGIGDVVVCLINLCHILGTTVPECLQLAYTEIRSRHGKMVNGVFVKEFQNPVFKPGPCQAHSFEE